VGIGGDMSNKIEVGDIVNIYFTSSNALWNVKVLGRPADVGDSWKLQSTEHRLNSQYKGQLHNVVLYERMDLKED